MGVGGRDRDRPDGPGSVRRDAALQIVRAMTLVIVVVTAYFTLPMSSPLALRTGTVLVVVLTTVSLLLLWEVHEIVRSPFPAVKAFAALAVTVPLFLVGFASTYFLMGRATPGAFSEPMTRLDALYFTVTVFATVGFGDIVALTQPARAVALLQMVLNLVLVGLIARVVVGAVQEARRRQQRTGGPD
jgi:hypothetical protein